MPSVRRATCSPSAASWRSRRPAVRRSAAERWTPCCTGRRTIQRTWTGCRRRCVKWWKRAVEKDPARRPDAAELVRRLTTGEPQAGPQGEPLDEPRDAFRRRTAGATPGDPGSPYRKPPRREQLDEPARTREAGRAADEAAGRAASGWLPEPVARLIAERSAAALALPDIEHTQVTRPLATSRGAARDPRRCRTRPGPGPASSRRSDRGTPARPAAAASCCSPAPPWRSAAGAGGRPGGRSTRDDDPGGHARRRVLAPVRAHPRAARRPQRPQRQTGRAQERGLRLAVAEFNARGDAPFTVKVRAVDDRAIRRPRPGSPRNSRTTRRSSPWSVPTTDATAQAALAKYDAGLLPVVAVSPGSISLVPPGIPLVPARAAARLGARRLHEQLPARRQGVRARSVSSSTVRPATTGRTSPAPSARSSPTCGSPSVPEVVSAMRDDFGNVVDAVLSAGADSVFFAGLPDRGALIAATLAATRLPGRAGVRPGVARRAVPDRGSGGRRGLGDGRSGHRRDPQARGAEVRRRLPRALQGGAAPVRGGGLRRDRDAAEGPGRAAVEGPHPGRTCSRPYGRGSTRASPSSSPSRSQPA